jgi:hypothetical protein
LCLGARASPAVRRRARGSQNHTIAPRWLEPLGPRQAWGGRL